MAKIVFLSPHDLPYSHISRNFDFARRLAASGHTVTIIANNFSHRDKVEVVAAVGGYCSKGIVDGVNVVWLKTIRYQKNDFRRALNAISYFLLSTFYCFRNLSDADYYIGDSVPPTSGLAALLISAIKGGKFIFQVRDVWPIALVYDGAIKKSGISYIILRATEKLLYRNCHKIFSTIPFLAAHVTASGASSNKITYIPNGVDLKLICYSPLKPNAGNKFVVTYAGGFGNAHDAESIVHAAQKLSSSEFNFEFNFYGDGVKLESCKRLVESLHLNNINFFKPVEKKILSLVLTGSDVLVAAVTDSDSYKFGINLNKLYDYFAAGRPIVLACRSHHRPIEDAGCGYIVDPEQPSQIAERILDICRLSAVERTRLGYNARRYAERNYDLDNLAVIFSQNIE